MRANAFQWFCLSFIFTGDNQNRNSADWMTRCTMPSTPSGGGKTGSLADYLDGFASVGKGKKEGVVVAFTTFNSHCPTEFQGPHWVGGSMLSRKLSL